MYNNVYSLCIRESRHTHTHTYTFWHFVLVVISYVYISQHINFFQQTKPLLLCIIHVCIYFRNVKRSTTTSYYSWTGWHKVDCIDYVQIHSQPHETQKHSKISNIPQTPHTPQNAQWSMLAISNCARPNSSRTLI